MENNKNKGIRLCDYIEIVDENDDILVYNVFYNKEYGYCLITEDEPLIKFLHINNSVLESYYINGERRVKAEQIKSILVNDSWLASKEKGFAIEGSLLQYTFDMAVKYDLNKEENYDKSVDYKEVSIKRRKIRKGNN